MLMAKHSPWNWVSALGGFLSFSSQAMIHSLGSVHSSHLLLLDEHRWGFAMDSSLLAHFLELDCFGKYSGSKRGRSMYSTVIAQYTDCHSSLHKINISVVSSLGVFESYWFIHHPYQDSTSVSGINVGIGSPFPVWLWEFCAHGESSHDCHPEHWHWSTDQTQCSTIIKDIIIFRAPGRIGQDQIPNP